MQYVEVVKQSKITFQVLSHGRDLHISITGGERPHIGAVAVAQARPSLSGNDRISASTSVITICGHKEDQIAKNVSEAVAKHINGIVSVSCGIHFDNIDTATIIEIRHAITTLQERLLTDLCAERN